MSSKVPTVRQTNWISIIPHLVIMGVIVLIWHQFNPEKAFLFGAMTYLVISFSLRNLIPKDHRNGIKKNNAEKFKDAIPDFEKSYAFFKRNEWIDKYRFITLLSSSKMSYREMALANIGFCYSQIGDGIKSKEYYERTLKEFPESGLAKSALKMMSAMEKNAPQHRV
jgi:tetratricopeptide (TPR) repeat protein